MAPKITGSGFKGSTSQTAHTTRLQERNKCISIRSRFVIQAKNKQNKLITYSNRVIGHAAITQPILFGGVRSDTIAA